MRILLINEVCGVTSTGTICADLAEYLIKRGHDVRAFYGRLDAPSRCDSYGVRIAGKSEVMLSALSARLFDNCGRGNRHSTRRAIGMIRDFKPDIVHIHNLHGYYINYPMLFAALAEMNVPVVQTLHDCWSVTGHCAYFDNVGCDKWKNGCGACPQKKEYPRSVFLDRSASNLLEKKKAYDRLKNLKIVVPSTWLRDIVRSSILQRDAVIIPNGIDTEIFRPHQTDYFEKKGLTGKKVIIGVASLWEPRKGLNFFKELSKQLSDEYRIVLVGVRQEQKKEEIYTIDRTSDKEELASIYSGAYVYLNPTLEDNYPTTNLEAICCGTPVITFATGGSPESAEHYGIVCEKNTDSILDTISRIDSLPAENNSG